MSAKYVTDHAMIRYLEREYGITPETIQNEILDKNDVKTINRIINGKFVLNCGLRAILQNKMVVTIY